MQFCPIKRTEIQVAMLLHRARFRSSLRFLNGFSYSRVLSLLLLMELMDTKAFIHVMEKLKIKTSLRTIFNTDYKSLESVNLV